MDAVLDSVLDSEEVEEALDVLTELDEDGSAACVVVGTGALA